MERPRIGVSACLLGEPVRFDGGHRRDRFLTDTLGKLVAWVPVCPEVESGLPAPRETLRLVDTGAGRRLVMAKSGTDWTEAMDGHARRRVEELAAAGLHGFVLKKNSPSCGLLRVRVYAGDGAPARVGRGRFAAELCARLPHLPVEEEGRLADPRLRESFIERVFAYQRLGRLLAGGITPGRLVAFHTAHKLQLLAHSPQGYAALGRLVAAVRELTAAEVTVLYPAGFMAALAAPARRGGNSNVLEHMLGYVSDELDAASRRELVDLIGEYRRGLLPLVVPLTLLGHHARRQEVKYLLGQTFLAPHPRELMLRNHV